MLTKKQYQLLRFIHVVNEKCGHAPDYDHIQVALGIHSKASLSKLIDDLEKKGFLQKGDQAPNTIKVNKLPADDLYLSQNSDKDKVKNCTSHALKKVIHRRANKNSKPCANDVSAFHIPLYGKIAAGSPIEAFTEVEKWIPIPMDLVEKGSYYALTVSGDSMIEAGIHDGDIAIIRHQIHANTGDTIVAMVDDSEVTLKKYRERKNTVALEPANSEYETYLYPKSRVKVQGVLSGLLKKYN